MKLTDIQMKVICKFFSKKDLQILAKMEYADFRKKFIENPMGVSFTKETSLYTYIGGRYG